MFSNKEAWLTSLTIEEIEILNLTFELAALKIWKEYEDQNDFGHEMMDLCADLHASWEIVWPEERLRRSKNGKLG